MKISGTRSAIVPSGPYTCRQHWEIEAVLAASGQPHVILRPNAFMQTLIGQILLPAVKATGVVLNAIAQAGISFIDARDIAACAAVALTSSNWDGAVMTLTGPRAVTYQALADLITAHSGQPVELREITPADLRASLSAKGVEEWEAGHFEQMYQLFRDGESEFVTGDVLTMTGQAPRDVEDYLSEVFAGSAAGKTTAGSTP